MSDPRADPDGVVAIACSLSDGSQATRLHEWRDALSLVMGREAVENGIVLHFAADPKLAAHLADLMVREHECCPFFAFNLAVDSNGVTVSVTAPPEGNNMLTDLFGDSLTTRHHA